MHVLEDMENTINNISAIIIAKNEQDRIARCIDSVSWIDEIIVIDNGSTDNTASIAEKKGALILSSRTNSFSELRTVGLQRARSDWILYVDADEVVTEDLKEEILSTVNTHEFNGYFIKRRNYYLGQKWPTMDRMQRLFYKPMLKEWRGELHETAVIEGPMGVLKQPLIHNTHRTLEEMVAKTNEWSEIEAKLRLRAHHPRIVWWRLLRVMLTALYDSFIRQGGWRAGTAGLIESIYQSFSIFITYAKLWELQQSKITGHS